MIDFVGYFEKLDAAGATNLALHEFATAMGGLGYSSVSFLQLAQRIDDARLAYDTVKVVGLRSSQMLELDRTLVHAALCRSGATVIQLTPDQNRLIHGSDPIADTTREIEDLCITLRGNGGAVALVFAKKTADSQNSLALVDGVAAAFFSRYLSLESMSRPDVFLTEKETKTLRLIATGMTKNDIATEQGVSCHAIDFHYRNILKKYRTKRMLVAVVKAVRGGVV